MVIFGAGASYGSTPLPGRSQMRDPGYYMRERKRPPLAEGLTNYPAIAAEYPASRAVIEYLERAATTHGTGFEDALASFGALAEKTTTRMQQLVAFRFYLARVISSVTTDWLGETHGKTYYLRLFNYLLEWQDRSQEPIMLVTFNYDTLVEDALGSVFPDWRLNSFDSYLKGPRWSLIKLHGSIMWSRRGLNETGAALSNYDRALAGANQLASPDLEFELRTGLADGAEATAVFFPALAVPMAHKMTFECPRIHLEALETVLPEIDRVLICGWRAAESHMVELLQKIPPRCRLGVVTGSDKDLDETLHRLGEWGQYSRMSPKLAAGMEGLLESEMTGNLLGLLSP